MKNYNVIMQWVMYNDYNNIDIVRKTETVESATLRNAWKQAKKLANKKYAQLINVYER